MIPDITPSDTEPLLRRGARVESVAHAVVICANAIASETGLAIIQEALDRGVEDIDIRVRIHRQDRGTIRVSLKHQEISRTLDPMFFTNLSH